MGGTVVELACLLAAGEGTRLGATVALPKSLVRVGDRALIDIQLDRLARVGVKRAIVVIRPEHDAVAAGLVARQAGPQLALVRCASRGGAETLFAAAASLAGTPFLLCTVDSFFAVADLVSFLDACQQLGPASTMVLAVTKRTSDAANDVGVVLDAVGRVLDIGKHLTDTTLVCEGPMWCSAELFGVSELAWAAPSMSLTAFQRRLVEVGLPLTASVLPWAMDVDTATDVDRAEQWLRLNPLER